MISLKSQLVKATLAATAAIPLATAGMFASVCSAQAAALTGEFQFSGGVTANPSAISQVTLSKDALIFSPQPITPIGLGSTTGTFTSFNTGNIGNIISFTSQTADNPFIDLGNLTLPGVILPTDNTTSLTDGLNTFTLTSSSYTVSNSGANVGIDVALFGYFTSATGEITNGAGNLTFQANNTTAANVNALLNGGGSLSNLNFSGATFTTSVPEPSTMLGLGIVGAGMVMSRRRKRVAQ